jgi:hypothetical protein
MATSCSIHANTNHDSPDFTTGRNENGRDSRFPACLEITGGTQEAQTRLDELADRLFEATRPGQLNAVDG